MTRTSEATMEAFRADLMDPRHGTTTGRRYGCKCDDCRHAHSKYVASNRRVHAHLAQHSHDERLSA